MLLLFNLGFCTGVVGALYLYWPLSPYWYAPFVLLPRLYRYRGSRSIVILAGLVGGAGWGLYALNAGEAVGHQIDFRRETSTLQVVIDRVPEKMPGLVQLDAVLKHVDGHSINGRIRLSCYRCPYEFAAGEMWELTARLKRIHGLANPGLFDYEKWAFANRLVAKGSVRNHADNRRLSDQNDIPARFKLNAFIQKVLKEHNALGIIQAITLGLRHNIRPSQWALFGATGTGHLIAISGLHISLVFLIFYSVGMWLLRWIPWLLENLSAQRTAAVLALPPTVIFAVNAGLSLPTQRALIMQGVFYMAYLLARRSPRWHVYFLSMALVLLKDPLAPFAAGFWLSFGAVAAILVFFYYVHPGLAKRVSVGGMHTQTLGRQARLKVLTWVGIQASVSLATLPMSAVFFQQMPLASPFINLLAIPYFSVAVLPAALAGLFSWFGGMSGLSTVFFSITAATIGALQSALQSINDVQPVVNAPDSMTVMSTLLALVSLFFAVYFRRWIVAVPALLLPLWLYSAGSTFEHGEFEITTLDVGQGLAMTVETKDHLLIYDTGTRFGANYDIGKIVVKPWLQYIGAQSVDTIVISHTDRDHMGGLSSILDDWHPKQIYSSQDGVPKNSMHCNAGEAWYRDGVEFEFLSPRKVSAEKHNNQSCVLKISSPFGSAILAGDIEAETESALVSRGVVLDADFLTVPHHGSRTSSTVGFLEAVSPRVAVISRGMNNPFGHPHPDVSERLDALVENVFDTAEHGAVRYRVSRNGWFADGWRQRRYSFFSDR